MTKDGRDNPILGPPKSAALRRTIAIPTLLSEMIAAHLARLGIDEHDERAFLFTAPDGGLLQYANWRTRVWVPACRQVSLEGVGFHGLRRLSATMLAHEGVDIETAQTRLGHSDARLTIGLYAQAIGAADRAAAERLGEILYLPTIIERNDSQSNREVPGETRRAKAVKRSRTSAHDEADSTKMVRGKRTLRISGG